MEKRRIAIYTAVTGSALGTVLAAWALIGALFPSCEQQLANYEEHINSDRLARKPKAMMVKPSCMDQEAR